MGRFITVMTPCYNEVANVDALYERVTAVFERLGQYSYELVFVDNASTDGTVDRVRALVAKDRRVRAIVNMRNFGHIRSPYHGMLQLRRADALISLACDLQDPPELIPEFLEKWEQGFKVVLGVKTESEESALMFGIRNMYYGLIDRLSEERQIRGSTGFGLYDQSFLDVLRGLNDPYPYFRGTVAELGFPCATVTYRQNKRARGITKNNWYTLYDIGMQGIMNHSKVPLRLATLLGFAIAVLSLGAALGYLAMKLFFWYDLPIGIAPIVIGLFFIGSVQLLFLGVLGEYVGSIYTQVRNRPLVIERERINFED